ncbi:ATP-binding protein [Paenibacillus marinisediminis]
MGYKSQIKASLFITLLCCLIVYFFYITVAIPHLGIIVAPDEDGNYVVEVADPAGRADNAGITQGDIVLLIDGKPVQDNYSVRNFGAVEQAKEITIRQPDGTVTTVSFDWNWTRNISSDELVFQFIVPAMFLLVFVSMSIFLYRKGKRDRETLTLIMFFLTVGLTYYSSTASYRSDPLGKITLFVLLPMIPYIFMHFMNIYLKRFNVQFINIRFFYAMMGLNLLIGFIYSIFILIDYTIPDFTYKYRVLMSTLIFIGYSICLISLVKVYMNYRKTRLNALFKIMLAAHIAAFTPFVTMNLLPLMILNVELLPSTFTTLFIFALPFSYMYLFTSNTLFDIDFIFTRFKYYTLLALVPAVGVMFFLTIIETVNYDKTWVKWFQVFFVIYAGMAVFLYFKEMIDHRFRPKLLKQMYSFQDSIDRLSSRMTRVMKRSDLEEVLKQEVGTMIPLSTLGFLRIDIGAGTINSNDGFTLLPETAQALLRMADTFQVSCMYTLEDGLVSVVGKHKEGFHVMWISAKSNQTHFNVDELRWLKTITHYTSIVQENLYLIENLLVDLESEMSKEKSTTPWVLRLLFCLSENERRRLASDLHDSALQDQLLWFRRLESAMIDYKMSSELLDELGHVREGLLDVIYQIRETCNELRPPLLKELGLIEALESLIEHIQLQVNFAVRFQSQPLKSALNEEQLTSIYRIIQELLRNTAKHARANLVFIDLRQEGNHIYVSYKDDGIGMDLVKLTSSFSHMGLSGVKERVSSLEGEIEFYSEVGSGFEVKMVIPVVWTQGRGERDDNVDSYLIS